MIEIFTSTRVQILSKLSERPCTASEIAKMMGYSKTTVSYHLSKLSEAGLVERVERGKWVYYRITDRGLRRIKVEVATAIGSLIAAVTSIAAFAVMKLRELHPVAAEKLATADRGEYTIVVTSAKTGFDYTYLLLAASLILLSLFLVLKFRDKL